MATETDRNFWRAHMREAASRNLGISEKQASQMADAISKVGRTSFDSALNSLSRKENAESGKKLVDIMVVDEEEEESVEPVDEGKIEYHDYKDMTIQNHPNESAGVNDYSMLSVPSGHLG